MHVIDRAIMSYMKARCEVRSQHKLPTKEELYGTVTIGFLFSREKIDEALVRLLETRQLIAYGPYLSDHAIHVL